MTTNHNHDRNAYRATSNWTGRADRRSQLQGSFDDDDPLGPARGFLNAVVISAIAWALIIITGYAAWTMF